MNDTLPPLQESITAAINRFAQACHYGSDDARITAGRALYDAISAALAARPAVPVDVTVLPDGSAFAVASLPLPKDHWLYAPPCAEWDAERDTTADTPRPILTNAQREAVIAAARYAIRGATMCGQEPDFDPDAMVLNFAYALCGPAGGALTAAPATPSPALCANCAPAGRCEKRQALCAEKLATPAQTVPSDEPSELARLAFRAAMAHARELVAAVPFPNCSLAYISLQEFNDYHAAILRALEEK